MGMMTTMKRKCLHPVVAWTCGLMCTKDGILSRRMCFNSADARMYFAGVGVDVEKAMRDRRVELPCGKCKSCCMEKRKELSTRVVHEASMFADKCFITLTYNDDHLPRVRSVDGDLVCPTLVVDHVQRFVKRLRRRLDYHCHRKIRYFCVGEYGGKTGRPHYHILIFGWRPDDLKVHSVVNGVTAYRSSFLEDLWKDGFSLVEDVNAYTCRYCARYVTKKFVRRKPLLDIQLPEFILRSLGTGRPWFDKFGRHACELGYCTYRLGGIIVKSKLPKYYFTRFRQKCPLDYQRLRDQRILWILSQRDFPDLTDDLERHVESELLKLSQEQDKEML